MTTTIDTVKNLLGQKAAELVQDGMTVGLGTGTTAYFFIKHLGKRCRDGLSITAVPTSLASEELARRERIPLGDPEAWQVVDLAVDGADEIDSQKRMIKGGGGALLREKIVAAASREMVIVVDETKIVKHLGSFPLPVEVTPFGLASTLKQLQDMGLMPQLRMGRNRPFRSDQGNYIVDLKSPDLKNPEALDHQVRRVPGVVETGLFLDYAGRVLVGKLNGEVEIRP